MRRQFRGWTGRALGTAAGLGLLALPLGATWSLVAVDTATGEVAVASATCVSGIDLKNVLPVIVVGRGAAAAQSAIDLTATNRGIIFDGFLAGLTPAEIFQEVRADGLGSLQQQQYGIVGMEGFPISFSGLQNGLAKTGVRGEVGTIKYAIQGNVLAGDQVVFAARDAFLGTDGDLSQRLMAGMEAARAFGGDGRCSCNPFDADACGSPPAGGFTKTAHIGFIVVARLGDADGVCDSVVGCASGDYWLALNVIGEGVDPDPVFQLQDLYADWRAGKVGVPDGVRSTVRPAAQALVADGVTSSLVTVELADIEGTPLDHGGAAVSVELADDPTLLTVGPVQDLGGGRYRFRVTAGARVGSARLVVRADDGASVATLVPYPVLRVDPVAPLHCGIEALDNGVGADAPFVIHEDGASNAAFLLVGGYSGTDPGVVVGPHVIPLNFDDLTLRSLEHAGQGAFVRSVGRLDGEGRGEASVHFPAGGLGMAWIGRRLDWVVVAWGGAGGGLRIAGPVGFEVRHP